jgi:hypothetical protein
MRLIDADALIKRMPSVMDMQDVYLPIHFKELLIDDAPTVDAVPVRHGKWIIGDDGYVRCSVCGQKNPYRNTEVCELTEYCGWCGARMDEE